MKFDDIIRRFAQTDGSLSVSVYSSRSKFVRIGMFTRINDETFLVTGRRKPVATEEAAIIQIIKSRLSEIRKEEAFLRALLEK